MAENIEIKNSIEEDTQKGRYLTFSLGNENYGIINLNVINNNSTVMYDNVTLPVEEMAHISITFQRQRVITRDIILYSNQEDKQYRADLMNKPLA